MTTVILGTAAVATAVTIFAPCFAIPEVSYASPTIKPVMFCRKSSGTSIWLQSWMNWAAFSADCEKIAPLLPTTPTG